MEDTLVDSECGVTLIGGGPVLRPVADQALGLAPWIVAADGGADRAMKLNLTPCAVIGDLDSLSRAARIAFSDRLHRIREQSTTDFDKALRSIRAPFVLAVGFTGGRLDHGLAVLNTLARHPQRRCLLLSSQDVIFLAPPALDLELPVGSRLSLFPLGPVRGTSTGLRWPIEGIDFTPAGEIGTSNIVRNPRVSLRFDGGPMLVILPAESLKPALAALLPPDVRGE